MDFLFEGQEDDILVLLRISAGYDADADIPSDHLVDGCGSRRLENDIRLDVGLVADVVKECTEEVSLLVAMNYPRQTPTSAAC